MPLVTVMVVMMTAVVMVMMMTVRVMMIIVVMMTVVVCISVRPFGLVVMVMMFRMNRHAQPVQPRPRRRLGMEMQMLREKGVDGFLNRRDVHAQRGKCRKNHIAARTANTIKSDVLFHGCSISYGRCVRKRRLKFIHRFHYFVD